MIHRSEVPAPPARSKADPMARTGHRAPDGGRDRYGEAPGSVFEPTEQEILGLMRLWLASDPDARLWVAALRRRGEGYARRQLWQVRRVLWDRMRRDLSGSTDPDRARHLLLREEPLLAVLLRASRALEGSAAAHEPRRPQKARERRT